MFLVCWANKSENTNKVYYRCDISKLYVNAGPCLNTVSSGFSWRFKGFLQKKWMEYLPTVSQYFSMRHKPKFPNLFFVAHFRANIAPENVWLEKQKFPFGMAYCSGVMLVSWRVRIFLGKHRGSFLFDSLLLMVDVMLPIEPMKYKSNISPKSILRFA